MRTILLSAVLVGFAAPALADEQPASEDERLNRLEHMQITAIKDEPANRRLIELQTVIGTANKEQPAKHQVDDKTAALLAEIAEKEE